MRLGFVIPQVGEGAGPASTAACVERAESLGYDSLWVLDRLLYPVAPREHYPASADGTLPMAYRRVLDPLALLAFAAAHTKSLTLGTSILNLPWYNPVLLSRQLATLDTLAKGRFCLGIGTGWCPEEYEAAGIAWKERGKRTDEALAVMRQLWSDSPVSHQGEYYSLPPSVVDLKPVRGDIPVYMAAFSPAAMRRVAEQGDGWMPVGMPIPLMRRGFSHIRQMAEAAGREPDELKMIVRANIAILPTAIGNTSTPAERVPFVGSLEEIRGDIQATREAGADELLFDPQFSPDVGGVADLLVKMEEIHDLAH